VDVAAQLERRRRAAAATWNLAGEVVLVGAGERISVPGRGDRTYPFRAHSEYFYLTDRERPGGVLAFDPSEGWVDFVSPVTREERLWEGAADGGDDGVPIGDLEPWLAQRHGRPFACLGSPVSGVEADAPLGDELRYGLDAVRRQKDALELGRMRAAERATSAGFAAVVPLLQAGRTEREVQIELEAEFFRNGADAIAFDTIVASGPNSAVLHFPPTSRQLAAGELVLVDAGAEYRGYDSDVTRTYPVSGELTAQQQNVYDVVERAMRVGIERCLPDTEWRDVHRAAQLVIAEGLAELGLLRGTPESLVESEAVSVFFPHGVGHLVGLGIRDASEALPGRERDEFPRLRLDMPLLPGFVTTVEPGIYFVPMLVRDAELRAKHPQAVNWELAESMLGFGGIRLESNVLVADDGYEVLTANLPL